MAFNYKPNPVRKIPQPEIAKIGNPFIGVLCMLRRGMVMVDEDPDDLQDGNAKRVATQVLLMEAQLRLAEERGISFEAAGDLLSGASVKEEESTEKGAIVVNDGAIVKAQSSEKIDLFRYFSSEEKREWLMLLTDAKQTKLIAATLFMQTRFVWSFDTAIRINPSSDSIEIEPVDFPIAKGDRIRFDDTAYPEMQVLEEVAPGQATVRLTSPIRYGVEAQQTGYLLDFKTGHVKAGVPDWTIEDSKHYFSQDMLDAIFNFYQDERSAPAKLIEKAAQESEGNATLAASLPLSSASQPSPPSTGTPSTGEFSPTEFEMNGLATKTLEAALPG